MLFRSAEQMPPVCIGATHTHTFVQSHCVLPPPASPMCGNASGISSTFHRIRSGHSAQGRDHDSPSAYFSDRNPSEKIFQWRDRYHCLYPFFCYNFRSIRHKLIISIIYKRILNKPKFIFVIHVISEGTVMTKITVLFDQLSWI